MALEALASRKHPRLARYAPGNMPASLSQIQWASRPLRLDGRRAGNSPAHLGSARVPTAVNQYSSNFVQVFTNAGELIVLWCGGSVSRTLFHLVSENS